MFQKTSFPKIKSILMVVLLIGCLLFQAANTIAPVHASQNQSAFMADNPAPPASPVKLIFIHHSTGENWLADDNGGLGLALSNNNYFVSDTNYGWGPNAIGDRTDIPNWLEWFRSEDTPAYMTALFAESSQNSGYTRSMSNPGGENEIIIFKSCFPNSALEGNPEDPASPDGWLTIGHAKYVYNQLLLYFQLHPDKLFVVITAPPLSDPTYAANARAFNQWLVNDWLSQNGYGLNNVAVFDFYNVLTSNGGNPNTNDLGLETGNHHRWWNGVIQHKTDTGSNVTAYPSGDDHPSKAGNLKATSEFIPLLNIFVNRWKTNTISPPVVTASDGTNTTGINVNWTASSRATSYLAYRSDSLTGTKIPPGGLATTSLGGTDIWGLPGITYYYWVRACAGSTCSDFSAPETGWRAGASELIPPIVTASDGTDASKVNVSWTAANEATYYLAYRSESPTEVKIPTDGVYITGLGGADIWGLPGEIYYYWVRACNPSGCSTFSAYDSGWR
jgi:hypothetical protein